MKANALSHTPPRRAIVLIPSFFRTKTHEEIQQAIRTGGFSSLRYEPAKRFATWTITCGGILVVAILMSLSLIPKGYPPTESEHRLYIETPVAPHLSHHDEIPSESDIVTE